ncbi:unnamed protein product [Lampetra planeri]
MELSLAQALVLDCKALKAHMVEVLLVHMFLQMGQPLCLVEEKELSRWKVVALNKVHMFLQMGRPLCLVEEKELLRWKVVALSKVLAQFQVRMVLELRRSLCLVEESESLKVVALNKVLAQFQLSLAKALVLDCKALKAHMVEVLLVEVLNRMDL